MGFYVRGDAISHQTECDSIQFHILCGIIGDNATNYLKIVLIEYIGIWQSERLFKWINSLCFTCSKHVIFRNTCDTD